MDKLDMRKVADEASERLCETFRVPRAEITYKLGLDMGARCGEAIRVNDAFIVRLNPCLLLQLPPYEAKATLEHEICHCYDWLVAKQWGHGVSWQLLMRVLGYDDPQPCKRVSESVQIERRKYPRTACKCAACGAVNLLSLTDKRKVLNGSSRRSCRRCGGVLSTS